MKGENLFDAMSYIDAEFIEKADKAPKKAKKNVYVSNKRHKNRWISFAATAMVALMICSVALLNHIFYPGSDLIGDTTTTTGNDIYVPGGDATTTPDNDTPGGDATTTPDNDTPGGDATTAPDNDTPGGDATTAPDNDTLGEDVTTVPDNDTTGEDTTTPPDDDIYIPNDTLLLTYSLASPSYPEMTKYTAGYDAWRDAIKEQWKYYNAGKNLAGFFNNSIQSILGDATTENAVYSPVNVYMTLAMLAEVTSGNTRAQILNALNANSMEELRTQANSVWNACYRDDGKTISRMASSVWLNEEIKIGDTSVLAENYYASVFQGDISSAEYSEAYTEWLKKETGGFLNDLIGDKKFDSETVMTLVSTLYFKASWDKGFNKKLTTEGVFHSPTGDVTCDFMNQKSNSTYFYGEMFSATCKELGNDGYMYFILPDENVSISELLSNDEALAFINDPWNVGNNVLYKVNLSLPKFDISMKKDLKSDIEALGITDCFDSDNADFSEFLPENKPSVSKMEHGVRVSIDEESCSGAAYFEVVAWGASPSEEVDFTLDRPFIFVVTSPDGLPLFVGVVNNPN